MFERANSTRYTSIMVSTGKGGHMRKNKFLQSGQYWANRRCELKALRFQLEAMDPNHPAYQKVWRRAESLRQKLNDSTLLPRSAEPPQLDETLEAMERHFQELQNERKEGKPEDKQ